MLTVHDLRKQGYRVTVIHNRHMSSPNYFGKTILKTKGGLTEVVIESNEQVMCRGHAVCSDKDDYNKKLGVRIALGRALKTMGMPTK